jgi:hypothetical protein
MLQQVTAIELPSRSERNYHDSMSGLRVGDETSVLQAMLIW